MNDKMNPLEALINELPKYIQPKSTTWWVGVISIAGGLITKNYELVSIGAGLIGGRKAIQKLIDKL